MSDRRFLWLSLAAFAVAAVLATVTNAEVTRPEARPAAFVIASPAPVAPLPLAPEPDTTPTSAAPPPEAAPAPEATAASLTAPAIGPETNLPLPRFVSLKSDEGNVRRGPSLSHRIDWVFVRRGMPLQVTAEYGHWRRVVLRLPTEIVSRRSRPCWTSR